MEPPYRNLVACILVFGALASGLVMAAVLAQDGPHVIVLGALLFALPWLGLVALLLMRSRIAFLVASAATTIGFVLWVAGGMWTGSCWDCTIGSGHDPPSRELIFVVYAFLGALGLNALNFAVLLMVVVIRQARSSPR